MKVLQIKEETAETTACRMAHTVDKKTLESLVRFFDFVYHCPRAGDDWIKSFVKYCSKGKPDDEICKTCIQKCKA